ncbi:hypothetical protein ACOME3_002854 [Neoechinorhynchus agilis]
MSAYTSPVAVKASSRVNELSQLGYDAINRALQLEESGGNPRNALPLYRQGAEYFEASLRITVRGYDQSSVGARQIQAKIKDILFVRTRLTELEQQLSRPTTPMSRNRTTYEDSPPSYGKATKSEGKRVFRIPNVEKRLVEIILDEIVERSTSTDFEEIVGLEKAKEALNETVILPALKPQVFTGLRSPAKGILLFGPPGNGKTMLARAVAKEAQCNFFNISASTLTSKYVGEGEKLVRSLFEVAREIQPSVIFIDEVDSFLCERKDTEHEASRRMKTEFLLRFDGLSTSPTDRLIVMGATNRPQELDVAIIRRFPKRIYVGMPNFSARLCLLRSLLSAHDCCIGEAEMQRLAELTRGYSASDLTELAKDAALQPVREMSRKQLEQINDSRQFRPIESLDFDKAMKNIRPSVSQQLVDSYLKWNQNYGNLA